VLRASNLESTTTSNDGFVFNGILDSTETITDSIIDLVDGMRIGSFDKQGNTLGILDLFDECELFLSKDMLINESSPSEVGWCKVVNRVLSDTAANKLQSLHVASLCSAESKNVVLSKDIQRKRVNTLLVDDNETIVSVFARANSVLEVNDLANLLVNVLSL
jgi:hypothetical protein